MKAKFAVLIAGAAFASLAQAMPPAAKLTDGVFTNAAGMTLYTFDRDATGSGKSVCNGPCAANWPPLAADSTAGADADWTVIARDDGAKQWAYKGKPLYLWVKDTKPGERSGQGFNGVWQVAKP